MVWEPKQCCCCSVRVGTLMFGWLALICNAILVLTLLPFMAVRREDLVEWCRNISSSDPDGNISPSDPDGIHTHDQGCDQFLVYLIPVMGVRSGLGVIISILLLIGVHKKKHLLMLPYLIIHKIELVFSCLIGVISIIIILAYYGFALEALMSLLSIGVTMFLEVYFSLVMWACYMEVKQHNKGMGADSNIAYVEQRDAIYNYKI